MRKIKRNILIILILMILFIVGCGKNEGKVTIKCIGDQINAGVEGKYGYTYRINSNQSRTFDFEWDTKLFQTTTKKVDLYAEDAEYPNLYN